MHDRLLRTWGIAILCAAGLAGCASLAPRKGTLPAAIPTAGAFIDPLPGSRVVSPFGKRRSKRHEGVDLKKSEGGGEIVIAARAGTVEAARRSRSYGLMVIIVHPDDCRTLYAHLKRILVTEGQKVSAGQEIGIVGRTGHATGPHLHYEIRTCNGDRIDPVPYLRPAVQSVKSVKEKTKGRPH